MILKHKICLGLSGLLMAVFWQRGIHVWRYEEKADFGFLAVYRAVTKRTSVS